MSSKLEPDYAEAYIQSRASALPLQGDNDRAIADYNKAIPLKPDYAGAYNYRGRAYRYKGDTDHAIADYDKAIELSWTMPRPTTIAGSFTPAKATMTTPSPTTARPSISSRTMAAPTTIVGSLTSIAGWLTTTQSTGTAPSPTTTKLIELNPDFFAAYTNRGVAYARKSDYDRAIAHYDTAIQRKQDDARFYYGRGRAHASKGDIALAIADFKKFWN